AKQLASTPMKRGAMTRALNHARILNQEAGLTSEERLVHGETGSPSSSFDPSRRQLDPPVRGADTPAAVSKGMGERQAANLTLPSCASETCQRAVATVVVDRESPS